MDKAYDLLNPAGILMIVVPSSFMQSEFWEKRRISTISFLLSGNADSHPMLSHPSAWITSTRRSWYSCGIPDI